MRRALCAVATLLLTKRADATDVDGQVWAQVVGQGTIVKPFRWYMEVQSRFSEFDSSVATQLLVRPAIGVVLPAGFTLHAGYAWTPQLSPKFSDEQRPWQQLAHAATLGDITLTNRFRVEERFIENVPSVAIRLRWMVRAVYMPHGSHVGFVTYDEIFFDANTPGPTIRGGFAQNRIAAGLQFRPLPQLWLEPVFMLQTIDKAGTTEMRTGPTGLLTVWINL